MVLLKTSVALAFAVAFVAVSSVLGVDDKMKYTHQSVEISPEPADSNTTTSSPVTTTVPTSTTSPTTVKPTTSSTNTTTTSTTTVKPSTTSTTTTTTTTEKPIPSTTTTTVAPSTSTTSPNGTTTVSPAPEPQPTPRSSWDGSSFLGGMVLAFGIVAVGFVGYRFFYLGRGGAYHTL